MALKNKVKETVTGKVGQQEYTNTHNVTSIEQSRIVVGVSMVILGLLHLMLNQLGIIGLLLNIVVSCFIMIYTGNVITEQSDEMGLADKVIFISSAIIGVAAVFYYVILSLLLMILGILLF